MKKDSFVNSPLKKGDKGGCEPEVGALSSGNGRRNQETTPSAPFIKGEFFHRFPSLPVSSGTYG
jgi:hypothetical protein